MKELYPLISSTVLALEDTDTLNDWNWGIQNSLIFNKEINYQILRMLKSSHFSVAVGQHSAHLQITHFTTSHYQPMSQSSGCTEGVQFTGNGGFVLKQGSGAGASVYVTELTLSETTVEHSGLYSCNVSTDRQQVTAEANLTVACEWLELNCHHLIVSYSFSYWCSHWTIQWIPLTTSTGYQY